MQRTVAQASPSNTTWIEDQQVDTNAMLGSPTASNRLAQPEWLGPSPTTPHPGRGRRAGSADHFPRAVLPRRTSRQRCSLGGGLAPPWGAGWGGGRRITQRCSLGWLVARRWRAGRGCDGLPSDSRWAGLLLAVGEPTKGYIWESTTTLAGTQSEKRAAGDGLVVGLGHLHVCRNFHHRSAPDIPVLLQGTPLLSVSRQRKATLDLQLRHRDSVSG